MAAAVGRGGGAGRGGAADSGELGLVARLEGAKGALGPALAAALRECQAGADEALGRAEAAARAAALDPVVLWNVRQAVEGDVAAGLVASLGAGPRAEAALEALEKRAAEMRTRQDEVVQAFAARQLGAGGAVTAAGARRLSCDALLALAEVFLRHPPQPLLH